MHLCLLWIVWPDLEDVLMLAGGVYLQCSGLELGSGGWKMVVLRRLGK